MGVNINSGQNGQGQGLGGFMSMFNMFGGGGSKSTTPSSADPSTANPAADWSPQQLQAPSLMSSAGGQAPPTDPTMANPAAGWNPQQLQMPQMGSQYGPNDPFMQNLDAMGRRKTKIASGQSNSGSGGISSIASLAAL